MEKKPEKRLGHTEGKTDALYRKKTDDIIEDELADDTMFGEIIPSLMGWTSSEEQEERMNTLLEISEELAEKKEKAKRND
ncbi:hypothetical protein [Thermosediminibacter litoriperuensis]|uniref:Uncharacterized protein n=1 Tax=Thermosediminibacter litoriperuensis TaxID=291989 RepID=A0A5S5AEA4_9FIRM|nr:hypothetical protein [Thermosediminibacter litoriperuensis]TYP48161.1 hypothetical protein LZ11_02362 [Thermosediminibacter litoriperuensis]